MLADKTNNVALLDLTQQQNISTTTNTTKQSLKKLDFEIASLHVQVTLLSILFLFRKTFFKISYLLFVFNFLNK